MTQQINTNILTKTGFDLFELSNDATQKVAKGSNFMFGNGYLGYRGTFPNSGSDDFAACIVSDTYDNADGKWKELCNVPNGLFTDFIIDDKKLDWESEKGGYCRSLNLQDATLTVEKTEANFQVSVERFATMDRLHLLVMRSTIEALSDIELTLSSGIDADVWSLNGNHFQSVELAEQGDYLMSHAKTVENGIDIFVLEYQKIVGGEIASESIDINDLSAMRNSTLRIAKGKTIVVEKLVSIFSSNDCAEPKKSAITMLDEARKEGFEGVKSTHTKKWAMVWDKHDIKIESDDQAQVLTRFNLFHNIIHTPTHALLPVGARGLSCQAYQGAAFWDQEIFNMPMYLHSNPEIAKNILKYRYETLSGARQKALDLGYRGAFYAWISGDDGKELCPSFFFKDVISGRKIRNHFNIWQIHVSPDIAYSIWRYFEVTGDVEFLEQYGTEMMLDISLFLMTRSFFNVAKQQYEFIRLLGPDEYHENVDNNVFTNYQARYTLQKTMQSVAMLRDKNPEKLAQLLAELDITEHTLSLFEDMIEKIYIKHVNDDLLIEQFDGYFELEDVSPKTLAGRLIDKGEYWGWPNGVAVHTQVIKQADLIQLFVLHDDFPMDVLKANYDYYEPRTEHGSSLSPAMYSIIASKIGYTEQAYDYYIKSCMVDLKDSNKSVSGGTFIGGIHTASCGAVWQMIVLGFAGYSIHDNCLHFKPSLPENWTGCEFNLQYQGQSLTVKLTAQTLTLTGHWDDTQQLDIEVAGSRYVLLGNQPLSVCIGEAELSLIA